MKIAAFSVRPDEKQYFDTFANVYKVELQINRSGFTADDIESVKGCEAMSVCDGMCDLSAPVLEKLAAEGVKYIGFRTIGYNSVDLEAAKRLGIRVAHSGYSPYSVANYTVMLMLMCIRKALYVMMRSHTADYSTFSRSFAGYGSYAIILHPNPERFLITAFPILPVPIIPTVIFCISRPHIGPSE